jgi:hypothetical protein
VDNLDNDTAKKTTSMEKGQLAKKPMPKKCLRLASLGPQPTFKQAPNQVLDEGEYSNQEGQVLDSDDNIDKDDDNKEPPKDSFAPQWLRKE